MKWYQKLANRIANEGESTESLNVQPADTPIQGGRQTVPEFSDGVNSIISQLDHLIQPEFDLDWIDILEALAVWNHDVGYAIDNIVSLANTKETIEFNANISDELQVQATEHLNEKKNTWYNFADGTNSMANDFFTQLAVTGAISGEMVVAPDLSGIEQIVRVNPKNIRFLFDKEKECFIPVQQKGILGLRTVDAQGFIELNPSTYRYIAMRRFGESPYALPLFLTALQSIGIQKDMLGNLAFVMKKLGMLGFMEVLIDTPERKQAESDASYNSRVSAHLTAAAKEVSKGMQNGMIVGFNKQHEFKHNEVKGDSGGADKLYNLNETNLVAGLKQPGELLGRQYSTTETFGRVLLAKFSAQVVNFQKAYASFLKDIYNTELILAGFSPEAMIREVTLEKPMLGDAVREQTALTSKIANLDALYNQGVISQETRAQRLGEEEPDQEEPRKSTATEAPTIEDTEEDDPTDPKTTEENALRAFEAADDEGKKLLIKFLGDELGGNVPDMYKE